MPAQASTSNTPIYGVAYGKHLHISDGVDASGAKIVAGGAKRIVKANISVVAPGIDGRKGVNLGTFESKEIRVISKPSKKKAATSSAKSSIDGPSTLTFITVELLCIVNITNVFNRFISHHTQPSLMVP